MALVSHSIMYTVAHTTQSLGSVNMNTTKHFMGTTPIYVAHLRTTRNYYQLVLQLVQVIAVKVALQLVHQKCDRVLATGQGR